MEEGRRLTSAQAGACCSVPLLWALPAEGRGGQVWREVLWPERRRWWDEGLESTQHPSTLRGGSPALKKPRWSPPPHLLPLLLSLCAHGGVGWRSWGGGRATWPWRVYDPLSWTAPPHPFISLSSSAQVQCYPLVAISSVLPPLLPGPCLLHCQACAPSTTRPGSPPWPGLGPLCFQGCATPLPGLCPLHCQGCAPSAARAGRGFLPLLQGKPSRPQRGQEEARMEGGGLSWMRGKEWSVWGTKQ